MKHQFTITVDTPDVTLAIAVRDRAVGAVEDYIESHHPGFNVDCGTLIDIEGENDAKVIEVARDMHEVEGEVEIDESAIVSFSSDGGAYVGAWVWVGNSAIHAHGGVNPETDDEPAAEPAAAELVESEGGHCD